MPPQCGTPAPGSARLIEVVLHVLFRIELEAKVDDLDGRFRIFISILDKEE
jgi:hypothetical protein